MRTWRRQGLAVKTDNILYTRPRLGLVEVVLLLVRSIPLMLLVFLPLAALGVYAALQLEEEYVANSRVLVSPSDEYVFRPSVGDGLPNTLPDTDQLTQTEIELMLSPVVAERVMAEFGLRKLYPKLAKALAQAPADERYEKSQAGFLALQKNFEAFAAPKQSVVFANFTHPDAQLSADVLNAFLRIYLEYRAEIFEDKSPRSLSRQTDQFEEQLLAIEEEVRQFLLDNDIGDFESERTITQTLFANTQEMLFANSARQSELDGEVMLLKQQLARVQPGIDVFTEDTSSQSIVALELERQELLTRYKLGSQAVRDIDERIARARQYVNSPERPVGTVRRGPNPLYQSIETRLSQASAQAASLRLQKIELERQAAEVQSRQRRLAQLEPKWQELIRMRDLLEANVRNFATREVEARSLAEIAKQGTDNIKILEPARRPAEGKSLKLIALIGAVLVAAFTALLFGLGVALTRKGFVTPGSLERTVGLPVVSAVKRY